MQQNTTLVKRYPSADKLNSIT